MAPVYPVCPSCGAAIAETAASCQWCGQALAGNRPPPRPSPGPSPGPSPADGAAPVPGEAPVDPPRVRRGVTRRSVVVGAAAVAILVLAGLAFGAGSRLADLLPCNLGIGQVCDRVLFIGNSYTYVNDLPGVFHDLARAGGHRVETGMVAPGGATLADHAGSSDTQHAISGSAWEFVVIQEQSQIPSVEQLRQQQMYPAARSLVTSARAVGARPVFFETWAHRDGWADRGLDYAGMQTQIDAAYDTIGGELGVPVAPVGLAWWVATREHPELGLWQADGSHPTEAGTYLAACVLYATIFGQSPAGLSYDGNVGSAEAGMLQEVAAQAVTGATAH